MIDLTKDKNRTHIIRFNSQTVTCFEHTDQSVIKLVKNYYEEKYNFTCEVVNKTGKLIYKSC